MYRTNVTSSDASTCLVASDFDQLNAELGTDSAWYPSECEPAGEQPLPRAPAAPKGTFLDQTIVLRGSEGASLVATVMDEFTAHRKLRRRRHDREVENEQHLIGCMLANGLRCQWYRAAPIVAYQRKVDAKFYAEVNRAHWLSAQAIGRTVTLLAQSGLVEHHVGERQTSSSYHLTDKLMTLAKAAGVSEQSLGTSLDRYDLVELRGPKPRPIFDRFTRRLVRQRADRICFEPTSETEEWCDQLTAFNDFVAMNSITVEPPEELLKRWVAKLNEDDLHAGTALRCPEVFRDAVYRVFNDANPNEPTFEKGGRLVGGWWINAPEEIRRHIKIKAEATIELDYSACHPRMLYHEIGLEPPADLYDIPEVREFEQRDGCEAGAYRPFLKWLTQILINGRGRPDLVSIPAGMARPSDVTLRDMTTFIERRHRAISSSFRSGAGLRLMKVESEIAFAVVTKAMQQGWLALPIHDSFLAERSKKKELEKLMIEEYKIRLGKEPTITIK